MRKIQKKKNPNPNQTKKQLWYCCLIFIAIGLQLNILMLKKPLSSQFQVFWTLFFYSYVLI